MDRFYSIDNKLKEFAARYNAEVHFKGTWAYGVPPDKIQSRRILWIDGLIAKAVLITPHFVSNDFDSPLWDFLIVASLHDSKTYPKGVPFWKKLLRDRVKFESIESTIDDLLVQSMTNLDAIKIKDLKP